MRSGKDRSPRPNRKVKSSISGKPKKGEKDIEELRKALAKIAAPRPTPAPSALTLLLTKPIPGPSAPKSTASRKKSKLLINQYTSLTVHRAERKRMRQKGLQNFRKHLAHKQARVVSTTFDLTQYFGKEYQLPLDHSVKPVTTGFQQVRFLGEERIIHLVDSNGLHYASVIRKPDSEHFERDYQEFRKLQANLPVGAGAPVEALRGNFFTFHLMLSGQDAACMPSPYWNERYFKHKEEMQAFVQNEHVTNLRNYCTHQLFECFPHHAEAYQKVGQSEHYQPFDGFIWPPCFPSIAVNQEGNAYSLPHRDRRDYLQGLAAVFTYGNYTELSISFAEAKTSVQFPPGALCIFPSHVLHHFNSPILEGETRGSMTMFMSSDVVKWVGYGGRACDTDEAQQHAYRQQCLDAWKLFKTIKEKQQRA